MRVCETCGTELTRKSQKRFCSRDCIVQPGKSREDEDALIAAAKARFPSLNRTWDAEMVGECKREIVSRLADEFLELDAQGYQYHPPSGDVQAAKESLGLGPSMEHRKHGRISQGRPARRG